MDSDGFLLARLESGLFIDFGRPSDLAVEDDQKISFMRDPLSVHFFFIFKDFSAKIMPKNKLGASLDGACRKILDLPLTHAGADSRFAVGGGANPLGGGANTQICQIFPKTA